MCPSIKDLTQMCLLKTLTKLICGAQVSFAAKAFKIFEKKLKRQFSKTKKQGKGVGHTKICAVNI